MLVVALALALGAATVPAQPVREAAVRAAIERGVVERMGSEARVSVEKLEVLAPDTLQGSIRAVLTPGARTGRLVSFGLFAGKARLGTATGIVHVRIPHVRASRQVTRDTELTELDTADVIADIEGVLFERLPGRSDLAGARVRRDVAAGEPLTRAIVETAFAVRSGDTVEMVARLGIVEARGVGRASGSGHVGDRVRVSRAGVAGLVAARIVAPGVVELLETFTQVPAARRRQVEDGR